MKNAVLTTLALLAILAPSSAGDLRTAAALRDRALADPVAWNLLESLTTETGPRMIGTPEYIRARDWGIARLKALGFKNVHAEAFAKPSWHRGEEWAQVTAPFPRKLAIIGLGNSPSTPPQGLEAPIVVLKTYAELLAARPGAFKGKIVVVNQPMVRAMDGSGYGAAVATRNGDGEAAKRGAVAYLIRSVSTSASRAPHTGAVWGKDTGKIPSAALGVPDADLLEAMARRGVVRVRLKLANWVDQKSVAWNISGEVTGSAKPQEVVVIGGHFDSWDPAVGAIDDGAGVAITMAAASLINRLPVHPRRTVRVVLFGSEETGGSSDAYLAAHRAELKNIVITSEADIGADRAYVIRLPQAGALAPLDPAMVPLRVFVSDEPPEHGGSDVSGLQKAGVPVFSVGQDASRYFDIHHSADDTLAVVDRGALNQNVAVWASLVYLVADSNVDFRVKPTN